MKQSFCPVIDPSRDRVASLKDDGSHRDQFAEITPCTMVEKTAGMLKRSWQPFPLMGRRPSPSTDEEASS